MKDLLKTVYVNYRKPYLKGRYVVFESDDWGAIRMSSHAAIRKLQEKGVDVAGSPYAHRDALECDEDMQMLFELLRKFRGGDGKPAKFTFNNILGNPDFDLIRKDYFERYHWEHFSETLKRYPAHGQVYSLYQQGLAEGLIQVQFHGREHVNVSRWMKDLRENKGLVRYAFELGIYSYPFKEPGAKIWNEYMDAFGIDGLDELDNKKEILKDGLDKFESTWKFRSRSFISPCYIWHSSLEEAMYTGGVDTIQGLSYQYEPLSRTGYELKMHRLGERNVHGQQYFVRNAMFEPFVDNAPDWEKRCLDKIKMAFMFRKPAIISTHRANYAGFLEPANRKNNLARLETLLTQIVKRWPDVRFVSTDELAEITLN